VGGCWVYGLCRKWSYLITFAVKAKAFDARILFWYNVIELDKPRYMYASDKFVITATDV